MEFKSLKNIESSFKQIRLFGMVFLCLCAVVAVFSVIKSYQFAEAQRQKIYILDGGKSLMLALSQDLSQNRPVEAKEHIRRFHELFLRSLPTGQPSNPISTGLCSWWIRVPLRIIRIFRKRGTITALCRAILIKPCRSILWRWI